MQGNIRLNKYLARYAGISRREADRLIEAGEVSVDGVKAALGTTVDENDSQVCIGERRIVPDRERHYYAVYKPVGYISSTVRQTPSDRLVTELLSFDAGIRLFPVGRLDKDSEGLMLLTDDGELMDRVLRSVNGHEKEYRVKLYSEVSDVIIKKIEAGGIDIGEGRLTKPCSINRISPDELGVILTEGMNRQIRRVFDSFGIRVEKLCRVRFMNITLNGLKPGEHRKLTDKEIKTMKEMAEK
ncbi:MAG: rRNA pseudouridine synthase [Lachnospiraceae bacterium]|nr:rRNA pseudouridine synthase [Lachnospiraceae bacterium]